jgi:hypothetical protein
MCVPSTRDAVHVIVVIISYREEMPRGEHAIAAVFDDHPYRDQFDFDDRHVTIYEKEKKLSAHFSVVVRSGYICTVLLLRPQEYNYYTYLYAVSYVIV